MRTLFALLVIVVMLFVLGKLPFPGKQHPLPSATQQAAIAKGTSDAKPAEAPKPVTVRECVRTIFGGQNCKEVVVTK
ncbi:MAG: hypothetical protein HXX10_15730 [Rhodoplanes sp.]|uniref:hypothetical protein n=1 Tax=Rhodoplanes sp. TaxID=1968906 RepID=UPI0017E65A64|nr:hypothetical protein [Rhodoplanes sp.]NVO15480.1 hypothetical protein [Rhodoplanes sp.]